MKKTFTKVIALSLAMLVLLLVFTSCDPEVMPSVSIGLKRDGNAGEYNESLQDLEVGKRFHGAIKITMVTDKQAPRDYQVVIELPKTKDVEVLREGGLRPTTQVEDAQKTVLTFIIQGHKGATPQSIQFTGIPAEEGLAVITVMIYDEDGLPVNAGFDKTVYFKYELD